ncbi:MAG: hypothetical protein FD155_1641 [Bacteroidetes bacterium]|nr:MAG: hypothetical protein FD155_1641 [Bacteroidota bacterium]
MLIDVNRHFFCNNITLKIVLVLQQKVNHTRKQ